MRVDIEEFEAELRTGKFELDFGEITLERGGKAAFEGPGTIRQLASGGFSVKVFCAARPTMRGALEEMFSMGAGELYRESHFYRLNATDVHGRQWIAARLCQPSTNGSMSVDGFSIVIEAQEILLATANPSDRFKLHLRDFSPIEFPPNVLSTTREQTGKLTSWITNQFKAAECAVASRS